MSSQVEEIVVEFVPKINAIVGILLNHTSGGMRKIEKVVVGSLDVIVNVLNICTTKVQWASTASASIARWNTGQLGCHLLAK